MADPLFALRGKRVWVAGETGLVGNALCRALQKYDIELLSAPHAALDLRDKDKTHQWLKANRPDMIFMAAARVGGIGANAASPVEFLQDNLSIAQNVIEGAHLADVPRLVFLGSSCIYPKDASQPIREEYLLTGPLEPTNEAYALAKIAGLKLCAYYRAQYGRRYISAMPTNLYGPHDRFDADASHVIPAIMLKFHRAKEIHAPYVELWGTGAPLREFLYVDDLAQALLMLAENYDEVAPVNIGSGEEVSIKALSAMMKDIVGYHGDIRFDPSKPDGTMRKFLDSSKIRALGWTPQTPLEKGLAETYAWFCETERFRKSA
jgi:GDP-L-fucose synthase